MNHESEFEEDLVCLMTSMYGVSEEMLYPYLSLRYRIWRIQQNREGNRAKDCFLSFLIDDLQLPFKDGLVEYKGKRFYTRFVLENSLSNIIDSWHMMNELRSVSTTYSEKLSMKQFIDSEWKKIERHATSKAKAYKRTENHETHRLYEALKRLNDVFQATPESPPRMNHITYPKDYFPTRTMEEQYSALMNADNHKRTDTNTISEKGLSDYLMCHLELIEEGLRFVDREVVVPNGRIDILARDRHDVDVLIELKITEDKELFWQALYYPKAFQEKYNAKKVRMMTIIPHYPKHLIQPLRKIPQLEIFQYTPNVTNGKIESLLLS